MASIQIAVDAPFCTKKEFLRRTGWSGSSLDRAIAARRNPNSREEGRARQCSY